MAIGWYIRRLANMSPPEVLHRAVEARRKRASRRASYGWAAFPARGNFQFPPGLAAPFLTGVDPALNREIRRAADSILGGDFAAHGVAWPKRNGDDLFPSTLWRLDPITGGLWPGPELYCFDIPYRHERILGDIKYVWDLNRLQLLQPLAAAVVALRDEAALAAIETAIASWYEANPPFRGIAWNSGIELALRAFSIIFALALCGDRLGKETLVRAEKILRAHFYWLKRYPSRFSSANNHLVSEAFAEFAIGVVLPDLASATQARQVLETEARLQIYPDGVGAEQSPTYSAFTAEMLLAADWLARAAGAAFSSGIGERLAAFADWVAWMSDGRGRVPNIGDDDEGRIFSLCQDREFTYPASIARAVRGWFGLPGVLAKSDDSPELRDAIFSASSAEAADAPQGMKTFATGGYTIVRERRAEKTLRFVLDHGPLGYLSIAAHGHADANAFTLSLDDEEIFVDPGTYLYHSGGDWRDWFRGTAAHNTLRIGEADQSVIAGPFNWSTKARARLDARVEGVDWSLTASHDGYVKRFGAQHRREIYAEKFGLRIVDRLLGAKLPESCAVSFQAAPGLSIVGSGQEWRVQKDGVTLLDVAFGQPGDAKVVRGGALREGGWVSPCFGTKIAADQLVWRGPPPNEGLTTILSWNGLNP